jgi:hypothetical protein
LKDAATQAVKDAYAGLKTLLTRRRVDVSGVERKPESDTQRAALVETLTDTADVVDDEVVAAARAVTEAVAADAPAAAPAIGVDLERVRAESCASRRWRRPGPGYGSRTGSSAGESTSRRSEWWRSATLTAGPCVSCSRTGSQPPHGSSGWGAAPLEVGDRIADASGLGVVDSHVVDPAGKPLGAGPVGCHQVSHPGDNVSLRSHLRQELPIAVRLHTRMVSPPQLTMTVRPSSWRWSPSVRRRCARRGVGRSGRRWLDPTLARGSGRSASSSVMPQLLVCAASAHGW